MSTASAVYATAATRELAQAADRAFADAHPLEVLAWAARTFGSRLAVASSMADEVVAHLASTVAPGRRRAVPRHRLPLRADPAVPPRRREPGSTSRSSTSTPEQTVAEQDALYGTDLYARDPDACCTVRKVFPLQRGARAVRRLGQRRAPGRVGGSRAGTPVVGWDAARGMIKINPIATWSRTQVDRTSPARPAEQPVAASWASRASAARRALGRSPPARTRGPADGPGSPRQSAGCTR